MKKIIKKGSKIIRKREFLLILIVFFIIASSILTLSVSITYTQKLKSNKEIVNVVSQNIVETFEDSLDEINEISKKIFLDEDFSEIYSDYSYTNNERLTTYLTDNFEECRSKLIRGVGFIPGENEMELDETIYVGNYNDLFYVDSDHFHKMTEFINQKLEDEVYKKGKIFTYYDNLPSNQAIIFVRKVRDLTVQNFGNELGVSFVVINKQALLNLFNVSKVINGYSPLVVYKDMFVLGNDEIDVNNVGKTRYYTYCSSFSIDEYTFYGIYDKHALLSEISYEIINEFIICFVLMLIFAFTYYKIHTNNQKSFSYLIESFENSKSRSNLDLIDLTKSDLDVNKVIYVYNEMVLSYKKEKNNSELLQIQKDKFEIESLYSQINKHFIINVLSVVHSLIVLNETENANSCLENLSDYLRYNLSINSTKTTLKDEINSVKSYINLQKYRYPEVRVEFNILTDLEEIETPKMILQPLVENAYVHGLVNKEGKIIIIINREQDILIIKVMNSCDDISKEDIEKINDKITNENVVETSNKNHGIALKNIKKRLDMFYSFAKLTIQNDGEYTSSIIEFKLKEEPTC